jgi:PTS system fructose-specific IIC component
MQDLLHLAQDHELPAIFVRTTDAPKVGRIVVATGGGPNLYEQMWLAREVADRNEVPVAILHWIGALDGGTEDEIAENERLEKMCVRLLGMQVESLQCSGADFAGTVAKSLRPDDLLVVGAPSSLRLVTDFAGSLPDQLAKQVANPLILLSSPPLGQVSLRRLFWGRLIKPRLRSRTKSEALECLVNNLIRHNQLPPSSKANILERALQREHVFSTAVDCETAFPRVMLPGFFGVAGTMGIFPEGIQFDSADGSPTRFLFLLVTSEGFCDEYLAILSKVSKRMIDPAVRKALLACETPAQAINVLEPCQAAPHKCAHLPGQEVPS